MVVTRSGSNTTSLTRTARSNPATARNARPAAPRRRARRPDKPSHVRADHGRRSSQTAAARAPAPAPAPVRKLRMGTRANTRNRPASRRSPVVVEAGARAKADARLDDAGALERLTAPPIRFGLVQEHFCHDLYALLVQCVLWNQTWGRAARPVLEVVLARHPDAASLAVCGEDELAGVLRPIGLHRVRATRLVSLARAWLAAPPCKERRYRRPHYPRRGCGVDIRPGEVLDEDDPREAWEVAHLPGVGAYALDSYRIFHRDSLRGVVCHDARGRELVQPEWKRVLPTDKDLRAYLVWRWSTEGWSWDPLTGDRRPLDDDHSSAADSASSQLET